MAIQQPTATLEQRPPDLEPLKESEETPALAGVSASGEQDSVFTGEQIDVAWLTAPIIKALKQSGSDMWNPTQGPRIGNVQPSSLIEERTVKKKDNVVVDESPELKPDPAPKTDKTAGTTERKRPRTDENGKFKKDIGNLTPEELAAEAEANAVYLADSDLAKFDTSQTHQIPFELMTGEDQLKAARAAMAEKYRVEIERKRGGIVSIDDIAAQAQHHIDELARDTGTTPEMVANLLRREHGGQIPPPHEILAARFMLEESGRKLKDLAWKVKKGEATDHDKLLFLSQWDFHRQLNASYMGARADWGRTGAAFRGAAVAKMHQPTPSVGKVPGEDRVQALVEMYQGTTDLTVVADQVLTSKTIGGLNKAVQAQTMGLSRFGGAAVEMFTASILSGVGTQINNAGGNLVMLVRAPIDLQIASLFGKRSGYHADKVYGGEAAAGMVHMLTGWRKAYAAAMEAMKSGEPYGDVSKIDYGPKGGKAISGEALGWGGPLGWMADVFGTTVRAPIERLMGPIDAFFKVMNEQFTFGHLAYRKMMNDVHVEGLNQKQAGERITEYLELPDSATIDEAVEFGLYGTFQQSLGPKGKAFQKLANSSAFVKILMPFVRTPGNILKVGFMENTPLGLMSKEIRTAMFPKPIDNIGDGRAMVPHGAPVTYEPGALARAQRTKARMVFGSSIMTYFAGMALAGNISGSGPKDPQARAELMATKWRPRSILIRDEFGNITDSISYDGIEPIAQTIGLTVDLVNSKILMSHQDVDGTTWDETQNQLSTALLFAFSQNVMNKSYMYGVHQFMMAVESARPGQEKVGQKVEKWLANSANAFFGFSGLRRDARRLIDPYMRQTMDIGDMLQDQTPGTSLFLPKRHNIWGEPMKYASFFSNRYQIEELDQDPVDKAIQELLADTGRVAVKMPKKKQHGVDLTAHEYVEMVQLSRTENQFTGKSLKQQIWEFMNSPDWNIASPDVRVDVIQKMVTQRDTGARQYMFSASNEDGEFLHPRLIEEGQRVYDLKEARKRNRDPDVPYAPSQNFGF